MMKLIYTNDNCTGCNKCISVCPGLTVNHSVGNRIEVDQDMCIQCGACINECTHDAREYIDDTKVFFNDLVAGKNISLIVAPAFIANYPNESKQIFGYLKAKGVKHIYSVSYGADITTWAYINYIQQNNFIGGISQPCPAIVNYIEKYTPELIDSLVPIHSPMMCTAIYVKKYLNINDELAFLSPCVAKKVEIDDPNTNEYVKYNVTFNHLMDHVKNVDLGQYEAVDELEYGIGSYYPMPGGLKENVIHFLGDKNMIRQVEGNAYVYDYIEDYKVRVKSHKKLPFMVDALNCDMGCLYGTGIEKEKRGEDEIMYHMHDIKSNQLNMDKNSPFSSNLSPEKRLANLNKLFSNLNLEDFVRHYSNKLVKVENGNEKLINEIFNSMGKYDKASRTINCGACGHNTCKLMALTILNGCNVKENCIHFIKDQVSKEKEELAELNKVIVSEKEKSKQLYSSLLKDFDTLLLAVEELTKGNNSNAEDASELSNAVNNIFEFCKQLDEKLRSIQDELGRLQENNEGIISVSSRTNLLSLNASIESARVGQAGRGFAVIAENIKELSDKTQTLAKESTQNSEIIIPNIKMIMESVEQLKETVGSFSQSVETIAASTEEIASKSEMITETVDDLKERMYQLTE